jgi:16S rRNA (adenine1518-N6/adenine1519-N6)-dimethyltransferase
LLRVAFKQPRKTLIKNLSQVYDKDTLKDTFLKLNFALTIRPHQVCTDDYHQIYKILKGNLDGRRDTRQ